MKIISLKAENIQKLRAVEIRPSGHVVTLGGRNGQGKSSTLDSIQMALGGKRAASAKPVRDGEAKGTIELELDGGFVIKRVFQPSGDSVLEVRSADGKAKYNSPQALLDGFVAKFTFDPFEFARMAPAKQHELLRDVAGLDTARLDAERQAAYDERTLVGRRLKESDGALAQMPRHTDAPVQRINLAETVAAINTIHAQRQRKFNVWRDVEAADKKVNYFRNRIASLEQELEAARASLAQEEQQHAEAQRAYDAIEVPDERPYSEQLKNAEALNAKYADNEAYARCAASNEKLRAEYCELTKRIEDIDGTKRDALAHADFPLDGLTLGATDVLYNGIPFSQLAESEKLRVSVAMGLALNPKLKVLLIRNGAALDEDNLALVAQMAEEADAQVWLERVGTGPEVAVVIEDGAVKEDRLAAKCASTSGGEEQLQFA